MGTVCAYRVCWGKWVTRGHAFERETLSPTLPFPISALVPAHYEGRNTDLPWAAGHDVQLCAHYRGASRLWTETKDVMSQDESFLSNPQGYVTLTESLTTTREELTQGLRIWARGRPGGDRQRLD